MPATTRQSSVQVPIGVNFEGSKLSSLFLVSMFVPLTKSAVRKHSGSVLRLIVRRKPYPVTICRKTTGSAGCAIQELTGGGRSLL